MVCAINYADERYRKTQKFNSKMAKKHGADKVIEYTEHDLSEEFKEKNKEIFRYSRGGGYWIWKPWIIKHTLKELEDEDYLVYTDAGSAFVRPIQLLIDVMKEQKTDIMAFCNDQLEIKYSKRDALILMDCDKNDILYSSQICGGYIIVKKTRWTEKIIDEFLCYAEDRRIVTDEENVMGMKNYPEFIENRHDQTVWSLLCKKNGIKPFRDPSEWGLNKTLFSDEVNERSPYPQVIESHRNPELNSIFQLQFVRKKWWYKIIRVPIGLLKK